jgi:hypothetical protein
MKRKNRKEHLVELGVASLETKGGAMGYMDLERTKWLNGVGLSND